MADENKVVSLAGFKDDQKAREFVQQMAAGPRVEVHLNLWGKDPHYKGLLWSCPNNPAGDQLRLLIQVPGEGGVYQPYAMLYITRGQWPELMTAVERFFASTAEDQAGDGEEKKN